MIMWISLWFTILKTHVISKWIEFIVKLKWGNKEDSQNFSPTLEDSHAKTSSPLHWHRCVDAFFYRRSSSHLHLSRISRQAQLLSVVHRAQALLAAFELQPSDLLNHTPNHHSLGIKHHLVAASCRASHC